MNIRYVRTLALAIFAVTTSLALADPPARVGRIAYVEGDVSFLNTANDDSIAAQLNWPVTSQNLIATGRGARAEVQVGSASVRLDSGSELEVTQLDDDHFNLRLIYGSVYVRIKNPELAKDFALYTSQGRVLLSEPSSVRIDTERAPDTTTVSVLDGLANLSSSESSFTVRAGKRAELANNELRMVTLRPNDMQDDFDRWAVARDQRDDRSQSVRYLSAETTGYEDLDRYGNWETTSEYGAVWYPRTVAADWAPYRVGRWTWVDPWGWTWVDSAPWGYAPFHYGRWVMHHQRWCWAPGTVVARPVWAPAMVGWVGGSNWSVSFSSGAAPAVGWFPLAPHEVYVPSYRVSPAYIRQVNITHVTRITNVTVNNGIANPPPNMHYRNRDAHNAVSLMPQDQFIARRTVVVTRDHARIDAQRTFNNAPVSAVMPATIAHPPQGFARDGGRERRDSPRPGFEPGRRERMIQPGQPAVRDNDPPTVRLPMPRERNQPGVMRDTDVHLDRRIAPPAAPATQLTAPPAAHTPPNAGGEFNRRPDAPNRRFETPRVAPQPNPAQDAARDREHERVQRDLEAQRHVGEQARRQAEEQARAAREQRNAQPPQMILTPQPPQVHQAAPQAPLKQMTPPPVPAGQEGRMHHWQERVPADVRGDDRPGGGKEGADGARRPDRRENMDRR